MAKGPRQQREEAGDESRIDESSRRDNTDNYLHGQGDGR